MAIRPLTTTVLDTSLDPSAPMWGDPAGGWVEPGVAWVALLSGAGVPVSARRALPPAGSGRSDSDAAGGLLVVPDPDRFADQIEVARGQGRPVLTGPPPPTTSEALAVVRDSLGALVRPDLRGVVVLRLDDPGSAAKRHLAGWAHPDVTGESWDALWDALRGWGRLSVFCCPGWVEASGRIRPSRDASAQEWAHLDRGVHSGVADLECHGFTHIDPDREAWAVAQDRFTSEAWYRELWPPRHAEEPSVEAQAGILDAWKEACGPGTTLVAPGEAWGLNTLAAARRAGFSLFNSWSVCRLDRPTATWVHGIGSPYLDQPEPDHLADGLPAVAYWHDRDMALGGPRWAPDNLERWRDCGARRAWSFSDLARAWSTPIDAALVDGQVVVRSAPAVPLLVERP